MRSIAISVCLIIAICSWPSPNLQAKPQHYEDVPRVKTNQQSDSAAQRQENSERKSDNAQQSSPAEFINSGKSAEEKAESYTKKATDEAGEYWSFLILGARLKITDSLVALFTAILTIVAIFQFRITKQTDGSARISAIAAQQAAETAERALIAGQRAFVSVFFEAAAHIDIKTSAVNGWSFTPIWQNTGATPTRDMQNHINIDIFDGPLPIGWDFPDLWPINAVDEDKLPTPLQAPPKGSVRGQTVGGFSVDQMREVIAGNKRLYMWGWATYKDVFPQTQVHVTRFAVQIVAGGDPSQKDKTSFTFPFARKYNCSDEECAYQGYPADWKPSEKTG